MKYYFVINPKSGKKHRDIKGLVEGLAGKYNVSCECSFTERPGHATVLAKNAVKKGFDRIIACGGDGTIQETAKGLLSHGREKAENVEFGLLPCGSGNGLARNIRVPLDVEAAAEGLFKWQARPVDAGLANGRLFLVSCGIGLDADVAHCFNSQSLGRGILPYIWHSLRLYFTYKPQPVRTIIDGKSQTMRGLVITALIGEQYGGGAKIAPLALVDDGYLDLCRVRPVSTFRLLLYLPHLFTGSIHKCRSLYEDIRCKEIEFDCGRPFWFHLDGEDFHSDHGNLHVRILPAAFNMIRP